MYKYCAHTRYIQNADKRSRAPSAKRGVGLRHGCKNGQLKCLPGHPPQWRGLDSSRYSISRGYSGYGAIIPSIHDTLGFA